MPPPLLPGGREQIPPARLQITTARFDFPKLVFAHGWVFLAPFSWNEKRLRLELPLRLGGRRQAQAAISVTTKKNKSLVRIRADSRGGPLDAKYRERIRRQVRRMLRLDEDFTPFHRLCAREGELRFAARCRCGGILRAPTAFEDLAKTVCTTNCDWRNTKQMCRALCALAGGLFPTARDLLPHSPRRLARLAPVGYRAETIVALARLSAAGRLDLDAWAGAGDFDRIRERLGRIKGIGPYTVNHMMVLLGDYRAIPVDSEVIAYLRRTHFGGRPVTPAEAVRPYDRYHPYNFLAYKFHRMGRRLNYIDK